MIKIGSRVRRTVQKPWSRLWVRTLIMAEDNLHRQYAHTDPCKDFRWTAKECYEYMSDKPWEAVNDFYSDLVNGRSSLSDFLGAKGQVEDGIVGDFNEYAPESSPAEDQSRRWGRVTFKIVLSYHGVHFGGWQKQPGINAVQGLVERSTGTFVDDRKAKQLKEKGLPVEGLVVVAGRTDKGVTALNQVCSFYTWRTDVKVEEIKQSVDLAAPGGLRVVSVSQVSRAFHPNFCAKWRRYLYIFPISGGGNREQNSKGAASENFYSKEIEDITETDYDIAEVKIKDYRNDKALDGVKKPSSFSVTRVDQLLRHLEGKLLSYKMFARDTKASRNVGPPTECFVYHARAAEARLPCLKKDTADEVNVMCIELVANRFLRRMVRVLVSTVVREAAAGSEDDVLLKLMDATCRRATAPPAPPNGLCLVDVGYTDFDPQKCFIR